MYRQKSIQGTSPSVPCQKKGKKMTEITQKARLELTEETRAIENLIELGWKIKKMEILKTVNKVIIELEKKEYKK